jgi:hypothetical protein
MLRTKTLISDFSEVPHTWVYEHYLNLPERLNGQDVKIKSIFNPKDSNPSFFVYYSRSSDRYKFKDFSTDRQGDCVELVKELFNMSKRLDAVLKIINDYNEFLSKTDGNYQLENFIVQDKYKVDAYILRNWTEFDQKYWMRYQIGSKVLEHFNIHPLDQFTFKRGDEKVDIKGIGIYGFFRKDGSLYKIYQPLVKNKKFIKIQDYIQGTDQLQFDKPYLVICSSLKDVMAFTKLGFGNAEAVAPDSENTTIPEHIILAYKEKYKAVCTIFDNDEAGIKAMLKYKELYGLPYAHLNLEKDIADCVEQHGIANTRITLYPVLTKALTGIKKELVV